MRPDQRVRLQDIEERLADVFIEEADPDFWPEERVERYKVKRDATETASLLARTQSLMAAIPGGDRHDPNDQKEADALIAKAERRAAVAVERALERAKRRTTS